MAKTGSFIKPEQVLPEFTLKGVLLGMLLSSVLAGANAYLGLFAGMTVSASIPAAVISMAVLRFFRKSNVLENNMVQTAASAGESLAAGVIFTIPALILMGYWEEFNYLETTLVALSGGLLGVLFTIPLRNALIVRQKLRFPEGVATSEVLKSGEEGGRSVKHLAIAAILGGIFKLLGSGMSLWKDVMEKGWLIKDKGLVYFGLNLSPALIAVGYIVGLNIAVLVFLGGAITWWIAVPLLASIKGYPGEISAVDWGNQLWSTQVRYLGVGAMVVGGIWALLSIRQSLIHAVGAGFDAVKRSRTQLRSTLRTELDTPMSWVLIGTGALIVPIFIIYVREIADISISGLMSVLMVIAGFLFSAVAGYMAGLVGSSNNPISGVTIATILTSSLILAALMGTGSPTGPAAAILIGAVVACGAAIAGDNMQDLKAGYLLGATPRKQQLMQMIGVVAGALVIAPVLNLLHSAYGFGPQTAEHPQALPAPQATLMQSVSEGVFGNNLPWDMVFIGMGIAVIFIVLDSYLKKKNSEFRTPVLAVAVGLYLPFELDTAIMLGGIAAWLVSRYQKGMEKSSLKKEHNEAVMRSNRVGLLFSSGIITGEAILGILLAIPIVLSGDPGILSVTQKPLGSWAGLILIFLLILWIYRLATNAYHKKE